MELDFSADQDDLRDAIRAVLAKEAPIGFARGVAESSADATRLWEVVAGLGWPALTVPETFGGIGLGMIEAAILAEELGRVVAPGPLLATVAAFVPLVSELGTDEQCERWLGSVASGSAPATVAFDTGVGATVDGSGVELRGTAHTVIEAAAAELLAVVANAPEGPIAVVLERGEAAIEPVAAIDATRGVAHVHVDVIVPADRVLGPPGGDATTAISRARLHAVSALAIETVGVSQSIFDVALEHARTREQFGVPIGSFQAIKHKFADMLVALERARATGYLAALCIAERDTRAEINASVAKAAAGDCQRRLGKEGIQILGGIGYTWEHDMHLYVKRAKANEMLLGTSAHHRARIADLLGV